MPAAMPYATTVDQCGEGPSLVLVHGTPLDAHAWDGVVPQLADRRRVVTYDLRGHGSARATPVPDSYRVLAHDLAALLDMLGLERAHVAGHSFGGQVVQEFAALHPERLTALTVICARSSPFPPFAQMASTIEAEGIGAAADGALQRWFTPEALAGDYPAVRYARAHLGMEAGPRLAAACRLISSFEIGERLSTLAVPATYLAAERDAIATPDDMRAAAEIPPLGRFLLQPGAGHMLPVEQPELVARVLS